MQQVSESDGRPFEPRDLIVPPDYKNHWRPDQTEDEYHADKSAIGSSSLRLALSSPKAFFEGHFKGRQQKVTNDMELGRIIHMALLEGEKFKNRYVVMPEFLGPTLDGKMSAQSKSAKEKRAAWLADRRPEEVVVTEDQLEMITGQIESVSQHPQGWGVFAHGVTEQSGYYRDPRTGLLMKIKPDFRGHDLFLITDFKTAQSCDAKLFGAKAFGALRYDIQVWMYAYGTGLIEGCPMPENLFFMVVEKTWPYESAVYFMTDEQKNQARYDYQKAQDRVIQGIESGQWPQRQTKMEPLWTPRFFIDNDVEMHEKELDDAGI